MTNATIEQPVIAIAPEIAYAIYMSEQPVIAIAPEIAYAIYMSEQHSNASRVETATPEERREHARQTRAIDKAASEMLAGNLPQAIPIRGARGMYFVKSRTNAGTVYRVDTRAGSCTCEGRGDCWHMSAALIVDEVAEGEKALAEYVSLCSRAMAANFTREEEARLSMLEAHPYLAYLKRISPERLLIPDADEDIPLGYEESRLMLAVEHANEILTAAESRDASESIAGAMAEAADNEPLTEEGALIMETLYNSVHGEETLSDIAAMVGTMPEPMAEDEQDEQDEPHEPYERIHTESNYERAARYA